MIAPARVGKARGISAVALAVAVLTAFASGAHAQAEASKHALTPASTEGLHRLIRPQPGDYRWDEVPWYASIWHARKAAAVEDKPIFVFGTGGAGFNDPLGNC
jgi:hypothetical protein